MVKRINEAFSDENHAAMKQKKEEKAIELGLKKLSWEKYLLHITGVKVETKQFKKNSIESEEFIIHRQEGN